MTKLLQEELDAQSAILLQTRDYNQIPTTTYVEEIEENIFNLVKPSRSPYYPERPNRIIPYYQSSPSPSPVIRRTRRISILRSMFPQVYDQDSYEALLQLEDVRVGTSNDVISSLPVFTYKGENLSEKNCTICLEDFKYDRLLKRLTCLHVFHQECIDEWLQKSKKCPICNSEVSSLS